MIIYDCIKLMLDSSGRLGANIYDSLSTYPAARSYTALGNAGKQRQRSYEYPDDPRMLRHHGYQNTEFYEGM